jgi:hypothetical protein
MHSLDAVLALGLYLTFASSLESYVRVERRSLSGGASVTSLFPAGWLTRALRKENNNQISEVIWLPSPLCPVCTFDDIDYATDDDHVCSLLADSGITVHALTKNSCLNDIEFYSSLREIIKWRCQSVMARNIAIVCQEISVPRTLRYLADVALPFRPGQERTEVAAVVLLDPPPLLLMRVGGPEAPHLILQRYMRAMKSMPIYSERLNRDQPQIFKLLTDLAAETSTSMLSPTSMLVENGGDDDETWRRDLELFESDNGKVINPAFQREEQIRRLLDSIKYNISMPSSADAKKALTPSSLLGLNPTKQSEVAAVLRDRILVLNSIGDDEWGLTNCEEVSAMYSAGSVISLDDFDDVAEDEKQPVIDDRPLGGTVRGDDALRRHRFLARVITDWLSMLKHVL